METGYDFHLVIVSPIKVKQQNKQVKGKPQAHPQIQTQQNTKVW